MNTIRCSWLHTALCVAVFTFIVDLIKDLALCEACWLLKELKGGFSSFDVGAVAKSEAIDDSIAGSLVSLDSVALGGQVVPQSLLLLLTGLRG